MFNDNINQSINTIRFTSTKFSSKMGKPSSFFLTAFLISSLES
jgi:hypothetical protein